MTPTLPGTTLNVTFTASPPGFSPVVDFELAAVDGAVGLFTLRDTAGADLRLFLLDPAIFVPDYAPDITSEHLAPIGATSSDDVDAFVVATISEGAPVVNLLAPILVNRDTRSAAQVILDGSRWPLRAELVAPNAA
ncbi:MAG: flagellar assembly protein FliW [Naasia sp.]|jgi:flagellar assembly factor FliW|uniref:flagellar assembly protein FliW n=1 Tax=Naasia sp. TaxID=2546198 RepID=UPI00263A1CA4|nr:flagellar assembly protein FliW [Naasia sp.]MCU1570090.1 flagellar assembly protein FliW [Naasia sp.]